MRTTRLFAAWTLVLSMAFAATTLAQSTDGLVPRFERPDTTLLLERSTKAGAFFDVLGRKSAVFGYENRPFEVWTYPLKIVDEFRLGFEIENYPVPIDGLSAMAHIDVRPEATTITYAHAAFTVRQILFAPIDEPGVVMLLDIDTVRPLTITASFRPDLRLMWPAGLMTPGVIWEADKGTYTLVEETGRFVGIIGSPQAQDVSIQPYQEEPQDLPTRFELRVTPEVAASHLIPIVVAGSVEGRAAAQATYDKLLAEAPALYAETVRHYDDLLAGTLQIETPDERLNTAFAWSKIGIDKGLATNPYLGTGFLAGFRTSGNSERPGFAWFFGRDALWTAFATTAYGDYASTRTALDFLAPFQRDDGKIPHEVSQSAALLDWFDDYIYPWASADATPLFIIVHADLWRATGDTEYVRRHWDAIQQAYRFTQATDTDGNHLVENYNPEGPNFGHGWVEGGELYPPHEELYLQGLWIKAAADLADLADALGDRGLAREARQVAARTRDAVEATYWVEDEGYYAVATHYPDGSDEATLLEESTALQAVPMWWHLLDEARSDRALDHVGGASIATDWGARILSKNSDRYDPLSYHNGSVWPLFTGWASMGAYAYDRPHVGYQALMASALLTEQDALGYVTELLSGDYNTAFGRTSHHQVWSEAMVATPAVKGMLGLTVEEGGGLLRLAPQLPADWDEVALDQVHVGGQVYAISISRGAGELRIVLTPEGNAEAPLRIDLAPVFPLDAQITSVTVDGVAQDVETRTQGDGQRARVQAEVGGQTEIVYRYEGGTDVYYRHEMASAGAVNQGLRILRARAEAEALTLVLEGRQGHTYEVGVCTPRTLGDVDGLVMEPLDTGALLSIPFDGEADADGYVRRTLRIPLR